ncbi:MAG TPA: cation acetate symporter, partial [Thiolapillus brandeum]|nr:cation acetate symporter [Thiolapillus brandeum]
TMSLMIGTAGLPHVIMRFFTVPKVRDARASAGWALVFIALLYTVAPAVGAMARMNLMDTIQPAPGQSISYAERPQWFKNWEKTGLLKFEDKNGDGKIQYVADKAKNEMVKVDRDIMVLANPEIAKLPNWVVALVVAGGLAAALSTAAGLLLAIASSISHDLLKGVFAPNISEKSELMASRVAMAGAIAAAGYLGLHPPDFAAGTVALAFGLAASSIFPALMMGIFSKKMNKQGAMAGMLVGIGITLFYVFQHKGIFFIADWKYLQSWGSNWFMGIEPNAFGAIGAVFNFVTAFVVAKVTAPPPEHIQHMVEDIRIPAGAGAATGH